MLSPRKRSQKIISKVENDLVEVECGKDAKQEKKTFSQCKEGSPDDIIIGVSAVAEFLGFSTRTVHRWRFEFEDFPVTSDGKTCVWKSCASDLKLWKAKHADLFVSHKQRYNERIETMKNSRLRRW